MDEAKLIKIINTLNELETEVLLEYIKTREKEEDTPQVKRMDDLFTSIGRAVTMAKIVKLEV